MWKKLKVNFSDIVVAEMPDKGKAATIMRNKLRRDKVITGLQCVREKQCFLEFSQSVNISPKAVL